MLESPWSAVGNPTSAVGPSGLAPVEIHHLLLSNLTTANILCDFMHKKGKGSPYSITERRVPELIPFLGSQ